MQFDIFNIFSHTKEEPEETRLVSFSKYIDFIENCRKDDHSMRARFYDFVLAYYHDHHDLQQPDDAKKLSAHTDWLELIATSLFPIVDDNTETFRALSVPCSDTIFYSSDAFLDHLSPEGNPGNTPADAPQERALFYEKMRELKYAQVLKEIYGVQTYAKEEMVYTCLDKETGLKRYYSVLIDNRFVKVLTKNGHADGNIDEMKTHAKTVNKYCELESHLPLTGFAFEGFTILTTSDITVQHAVHKMRSAIINHSINDYASLFAEILHQLQVLSGTNDIAFGLHPLARVNDHLVSFYYSNPYSLIIKYFRESGKTEPEFLRWIENFLNHPHFIFFKKDDEHVKNDAVLNDVFARTDVEAYGLLPIFHNNEVTGFLEVSSRQADLLTHNRMASVDLALPVLSQFLYTTSINFQFKIDEVIQKYFTAVQPSVEWKFNDVALQILQNRITQNDPLENLAPIRFEKVQPLYGAIDIRNSTIERNNALYNDVQTHFSLLNTLLQQLQPADEAAIQTWMTNAAELQQNDTPYFYSNNEEHIQMFFTKACEFLKQFGEAHKDKKDIICRYLADTNIEKGIAWQQRRKLESAMQTINSLLNKSLDSFHEEIEHVYPCYFDRFRTDGVEYDIYIGKSLSPHHHYDKRHLSRLRYMQLVSMIDIIHQTKQVLPQLPVALQTTQLVYVNANSIDITFRMDEKRFDTEGSYNIRYQIIKKRIDKVHVRDTNERLTQPNTIAIVYSRKEDEIEYTKHLQQLQKQGRLQEEIEYLQLEELQGVDGLKALRVSV